jgi:4-hydroxybenzoate polyprenyltransferase
MIDITTTRAIANQTHPPAVVYGLLIVLALVCAGLAGYSMSGEQRVRRTLSIAFAAVLTATIYVIVDLEFPRAGLIRIDAADQLLVDVRNEMR